ncbi:hypothetical protein HOY82DRAFT_540647 [Tuber indicum]|nr:hypothetical protein HOY82DRAFT_540647 [Tuber indicum]
MAASAEMIAALSLLASYVKPQRAKLRWLEMFSGIDVGLIGAYITHSREEMQTQPGRCRVLQNQPKHICESRLYPGAWIYPYVKELTKIHHSVCSLRCSGYATHRVTPRE